MSAHKLSDAECGELVRAMYLANTGVDRPDVLMTVYEVAICRAAYTAGRAAVEADLAAMTAERNEYQANGAAMIGRLCDRCLIAEQSRIAKGAA